MPWIFGYAKGTVYHKKIEQGKSFSLGQFANRLQRRRSGFLHGKNERRLCLKKRINVEARTLAERFRPQLEQYAAQNRPQVDAYRAMTARVARGERPTEAEMRPLNRTRPAPQPRGPLPRSEAS